MVPKEFQPVPKDGEVAEFNLWSVDHVLEKIGKDEFMPECAVVTIDFLIRHGFIHQENEKSFIEIVSRIHKTIY